MSYDDRFLNSIGIAALDDPEPAEEFLIDQETCRSFARLCKEWLEAGE